jgi:hypothetical protein
LRIKDIRPLGPHDPRGLAIFYITLAAVSIYFRGDHGKPGSLHAGSRGNSRPVEMRGVVLWGKVVVTRLFAVSTGVGRGLERDSNSSEIARVDLPGGTFLWGTQPFRRNRRHRESQGR